MGQICTRYLLVLTNLYLEGKKMMDHAASIGVRSCMSKKPYFGDAQSAYKIIENTLGITLWESDLDATIQGEECSKLVICNPVYSTLVLAHFIFGDPSNWRKLTHYFLQGTASVVDGTHPFETLQVVLVTMIAGRISMEIEGSWSKTRESAFLFPWGSRHIKHCLSVPVGLLDTRAKECIASLILRGIWSNTSMCPHTNCTKADAFLYDDQFNTIYSHWRPMYVSLLLHHALHEMKLLKEEEEVDVTKEFDKLIQEMCRNANITKEDKPLVIRQSRLKYSHVSRSKPPTFSVQVLDKESAKLLLYCYTIAKTMKEKDIVTELGGLLISQLYPTCIASIKQMLLTDDPLYPFGVMSSTDPDDATDAEIVKTKKRT